MKSIICRVVAVQLVFCASISARSSLYDAKRSHKALYLSEQQMKSVSVKNENDHFNTVLDEILVPRVVGTEGHKKVANYIVDEMKKLNWNVERNTFKDVAPIFGELEFENIIAKLNPDADRYLVLACHYDSKYMREHNFVGATDSAVPCSMMINLAKVMEKELAEIKENNDVSLAFIFFDGEEAFRQWGPKDSIYGARHLANKWHNQTFTTRSNDVTNHIDRIDVLVLLDLLGAPDPKFYSYFVETERWFVRLVEIEGSLGEMGQLKKDSRSEYDSRYFIPRSVGSHIEDDHLPFMKLGVPILHIIPSPFPDVWHKPSDNRGALDMDTIENLNKIFRVFVAEYLHIKI